MTNSEKATEISKQYFGEPNQVITWQASMKMAQWKDEQFKQILQVIYSKTLSIEKDAVIEQVYKKLFGEDLDRSEFEKDELKNLLEKIKNIEL